MGIVNVNEGTVIADCGKVSDQIMIITKGSVNATSDNDDLMLNKGDVIGLADFVTGYYTYRYVAASDVSLLIFKCTGYEDIRKILETNSEFGFFLASSITRNLCHVMDNFIMNRYNSDNFYQFILESVDNYKRLCLKYSISAKELPLDNLEQYHNEDVPENWLAEYYESILKMDSEASRALFNNNPGFLIGYLIKASYDIHTYLEIIGSLDEYQSQLACLLLSPNHLDLFDLYASLMYKVAKSGEDTISLGAIISKIMIQMEGRSSIDAELYHSRINEYRESLSNILDNIASEEDVTAVNAVRKDFVAHSLDTILEYAACSPETSDAFRQAVYEYKEIVDKSASTDFLMNLRKKITKLFYEIYTSAFQISLNDPNLPTVVKMFFLFGYVDEELAGLETATYLYEAAETYSGDASKDVYTLYEWLTLIYQGKKEPCRNEFDMDFKQYIAEMKANGKIDVDRARLMQDSPAERVMYELQNMFPAVNKISHGRITTYCPVLSDHNMLKPAEVQLLHADTLFNTLQSIRSIDYTAFYHECLFSDMDCGIPKESIQVEILPDIILMPNTGLRGIMWQEIEGKRRTTPARFMLPILYPEDISLAIYRLTGEYRWEMCKRVQGARWNDVSDFSLTSEYFDYIQFYRKNADISPDVREKIKAQLVKTKNNFRETFVRDYVSWLSLESKGSPVLNKVNRRILFTYCPFSKGIRERLSTNPLYKEQLDRYQIKRGQYVHHLDNITLKLLNSGKSVPKEIEMQRAMIDR